ncbi:hypothetical protein ACEU6E_10925 (plasmid) [Halorutilales archaeon Cl-col2-1]
MGKTQKSVRLPQDVAEEIETRAEERDISEADILRRTIRWGLYSESFDDLHNRLDELERKLDDLDDERDTPDRTETSSDSGLF